MTTTTYDLVTYPSYAFPQTHPDRLAVIATLLGLKPAPVENCRVLELGCASGGNIVPLAAELPGSRFLGIDNAPGALDVGRRAIAGLGLKNIELHTASILDVDQSYGQFDYIISHGIYSWVPAHVRDKVLDIYRDNLAPGGIGYISFNALPGWALRGMVRDMMLYHLGRFPGAPARTQLNQARELLDFLAQGASDDKGFFAQYLRYEQDWVKQTLDGHFFHDHLEGDNNYFYFFQFCEHLQAKRLRFLAEAKLADMGIAGLAPETIQKLNAVATDLLAREQYLDFLRNRVFRQCLVVHDTVEPSYGLRPDAIARFHIASPFKPTSPPTFGDNTPLEFIGPKGAKVATTKPIAKAAMCVLAESWPKTLGFDELCRLARLRLGVGHVSNVPPFGHVGNVPHDEDAQGLQSAFMASYAYDTSGMIELRLRPLPAVNKVGQRPVACPMARWQAKHEEREHIVNLRHEAVPVAMHVRKLLPYLDGSRDHEALVEEMLAMCRRGELQASVEGPAASDPAKARELFAALLQEQLQWLVRAGFMAG